jgi:hypothetical protein
MLNTSILFLCHFDSQLQNHNDNSHIHEISELAHTIQNMKDLHRKSLTVVSVVGWILESEWNLEGRFGCSCIQSHVSILCCAHSKILSEVFGIDLSLAMSRVFDSFILIK